MSNVYIIRNKTTLVQWVAESGKRSWAVPAHAKNAFAYSGEWQAKDLLLLPLLEERGYIHRYEGWGGGYHQTYTSLKFSEQDVYEIVELQSDADRKVMVAVDMLNKVIEWEDKQSLNTLPPVLVKDILDFLEEIK